MPTYLTHRGCCANQSKDKLAKSRRWKKNKKGGGRGVQNFRITEFVTPSLSFLLENIVCQYSSCL